MISLILIFSCSKCSRYSFLLSLDFWAAQRFLSFLTSCLVMMLIMGAAVDDSLALRRFKSITYFLDREDWLGWEEESSSIDRIYSQIVYLINHIKNKWHVIKHNHLFYYKNIYNATKYCSYCLNNLFVCFVDNFYRFISVF